MLRRTLTPLLPLAAVAAIWGTSSARDIAHSGFAGEPVSEVIFPPQQIPLAFSHVQHLKAAKLNCAFCHEDAPDSTSSVDNNIPGEDTCETCHDIDRKDPDKQVAAGEPPAKCTACHPGYKAGESVARVVVPTPNLKFNHKAHVDKKVRCETCHGELEAENVALATREQLPKMMLCLQCHNDEQAPAACTTCHISEGNGLIQSEYDEGMLAPSGVLRGDTHDMSFRMNHASVAKQDEAYCENCHRKEFCVGCHNGAEKPMDFHGNDYVTLHTIDARRNTPDCSACHRTQTFCVGCHSRSGVAFDGKGSEFEGINLSGAATPAASFHPEGWADITSRTASHHSFEAQRNIKQCASCHREDFCTRCHSAEPTAGTGADSFRPFSINPHPANWIGSRRCKALAARAGRMCLRCHIDPDEVRCD
jgi:hypothetical protein